MRRFAVVASVLMLAVGPALADPPADPAPTVSKTKKVCHPTGGGNPLYPEVKCHLVPVADTSPPQAPQPPAGPAQVAMHSSDTPH